MNKILLVVFAVSLSACGKSSMGSEMTGQVKRVNHSTPLICPEYYDADISMGVMRNGVGSMSTADEWMWVPDRTMYAKLKESAESGALVKVTYDIHRIAFCHEEAEITSVELVK
jgi:hypothetical protein